MADADYTCRCLGDPRPVEDCPECSTAVAAVRLIEEVDLAATIAGLPVYVRRLAEDEEPTPFGGGPRWREITAEQIARNRRGLSLE